MNFGAWYVLAAAVCACAAEQWRWPEQAASLRIDTKVRFLDGADPERGSRGAGRRPEDQEQADEAPFHEAYDTDGFYNRPRGGGRFPVRVLDGQPGYSGRNPHKNTRPEYSDGTLDSLQYCKCVDSPDCNPSHDSNRACGSGKFLCCYKKPVKPAAANSEFFNEIDDERPSLLPGREPFARPFPPPPATSLDAGFGPGHSHELAIVGAADRPLLVGPGGPEGNNDRPGVLVGPGGPTGAIGPLAADKRHPAVLVGPDGPTGSIGPSPLNNRGPEELPDVAPSESAQRGILVGPGGPTGIIGPGGYGSQRPRLVGPGGPTGFIGPRMRGYLGRFFNDFMGRQNPGILTGPGGPTGMIGPGRPLLVGPGGPTGVIGPQY